MRRHNLKMRLSFFIFAICLIVPLASSSYANEDLSLEAAAPAVEYYGRTALSEQSNAEALLYAYDQIWRCVENADSQVSVYDGVHPLSVTELQTVFNAYNRDHGEHFWVDTGYSYRYNSTGVTYFYPSYNMTGEELQTARVEFEQVVSRMLEGIDSSMSEFEREVILHDRLAEKVVYLEGEYAHTAYGALVKGVAVCDGYSRAFEYLLQRAGIQSFVAVGFSNEPTTGEMIRHAWNYVRIDGEYYQTDVTWDDQGDHLFHAYFNQSDEIMKKDHQLASKPYTIPTCSATDAMYFRVMGGYFPGSKYDVDEVSHWLAQNGRNASIYVTTTTKTFIQWMNKHLDTICWNLGLRSGYTCQYWYVGGEVQISITNDCTHKWAYLVEAKTPTCTEFGNTAYYECPCGWLFADANGQERIENPNSVLIDPIGHDYTEKINDAAHIKSKGADCQTSSVLWYDCSRCNANAKDDPAASGAFYTGTLTGDHQYNRKIADAAHLVPGSGADCKHAKEYYYQCAHCDQIGSTKWTSGSFGDHIMSSTWSVQGGYHFHKCTVSGCTYTADRKACSGGSATCKQQAKCAVCSFAYGALADHNYDSQWKSDSSGHWHECRVCGKQKDRAAHNPGAAATETSPQICKTCSYVLKAATGHVQHTPDPQWKSDETHHWYGCIGCADAVFEYAPHVYDNACDEDCNVCSSLRTVTHRYSDHWTVSERSHWHECACGAISDTATHRDGDGDGKCDVCTYTMQAPPVTTPPVTTEPPITTPPVTSAPPVTTTPPVTTAPPVTAPPVTTTPPVVTTSPVVTAPSAETTPSETPPASTTPLTPTTTVPVTSGPSDEETTESDSPVGMIVIVISVVGTGTGVTTAVILSVRRRRVR